MKNGLHTSTDPGLRLTSLHVAGMRTLDDVSLPLHDLTVLIGDNGAGKSSLLEALELLRLAGSEPGFLGELQRVHGFSGLLRRGAQQLVLGVEAKGLDGRYSYEFALGQTATGAEILSEVLTVERASDKLIKYIKRDQGDALVANEDLRLVAAPSFSPQSLTLHTWGARPAHAAIYRMMHCLAQIQVHSPFHTLPSWQARRYAQADPLRSPAVLAQTSRVDLLGHNLANAWNTINTREESRAEAVRRVRLGLGQDIREVVTVPDMDYGRRPAGRVG